MSSISHFPIGIAHAGSYSITQTIHTVSWSRLSSTHTPCRTNVYYVTIIQFSIDHSNTNTHTHTRHRTKLRLSPIYRLTHSTVTVIFNLIFTIKYVMLSMFSILLRVSLFASTLASTLDKYILYTNWHDHSLINNNINYSHTNHPLL